MTWLLRNWKLVGIGLLALALGAQAWRAGHYKALAALEKAAHAQTVQNYRNAQEAAQATFDAKIKASQLRNKELNDEADGRVADLTAQYHTRVLRHTKASARDSSSGELPEAGVPESTDGPGGDSILLARADALICADNTSRLQSAHDWAVKYGQ
jgi:hypothetical protein